MDHLAQNGESSRSPARRSPSPRKPLQLGQNGESGEDSHLLPGSGSGGAIGPSRAVQKSRLILKDWDVPPLKSLHPSHDLISLLSLASLYNGYVRPYPSAGTEDAGPNGMTGGGGDEEGDVAGGSVGQQANGIGKKGGAKSGGSGPGIKLKKLDKGYIGLLDDCIDPIPNGVKAAHSLLPLIQDLSDPPTGFAPEVWEGPIDILPEAKWDVARLQVGSQAGYARGEKDGVKEAEQKRQRKRERDRIQAARQSGTHADTANAAVSSPHIPSAPGTPLLPVLPPNRSGQYLRGAGPGFASRPTPAGQAQSRPGNIPSALQSAHPGQPGSHPGGPGSGPATAPAGSFRPSPNFPTTPHGGNRPVTPRAGLAQAGGVKRVYEGSAAGAGMSKKAKVAGTRSASPMPSTPATGQGPAQRHGQHQAQTYAQGQGQTAPRPGYGKGGRARTEGA